LRTAFSRAIRVGFVIRILAFALLAVSFLDIGTTTVASIEIAATVVVLVVAVAITLVLFLTACSRAFRGFVIRILAFALLAVSFLDVGTATVASIVLAATVVVVVVAVAVTLEAWLPAFSIARRPRGNALTFDKLPVFVAFDTLRRPISRACCTHRGDAAFTFALQGFAAHSLRFGISGLFGSFPQ